MGPCVHTYHLEMVLEIRLDVSHNNKLLILPNIRSALCLVVAYLIQNLLTLCLYNFTKLTTPHWTWWSSLAKGVASCGFARARKYHLGLTTFTERRSHTFGFGLNVHAYFCLVHLVSMLVPTCTGCNEIVSC